MRLLYKLVLSASVSITPSLFANMDTQLNEFFERFGSQSNTTSSEIYEGQKAGYLTGGGVTIRNKAMNDNPVTVRLPHFDAGCGGIDLYAGGFSFINSEQLVQTLKSVGSSSMGYAFLLGLETVSPQVASTIKNMQTWSNNINSFNINSCEVAEGLVGSVWPRRSQASQHICRTISGKKGKFDSYLKARHECGSQEQQKEFNRWMNDEKEYKDLLHGDYNLTWRVIQMQPYLANDKEMAELMLALMGTIIVSIDDDKPCYNPIPSKIHDETFLKSLLEGGKIKIKSCDGENCLRPREKELFLAPEHSWAGKIRVQLLDIQNRIVKDIEVTDEQKSLLAKSNLPLYKVLNVLTAYHRGECAVNIYELSNIVALDILTQFLKESVEMVREICKQFKQAQMYSAEIDEFLVDLDRVENKVNYYELRSAKLLEQELQLMQKVKLIEQQLASELMLN